MLYTVLYFFLLRFTISQNLVCILSDGQSIENGKRKSIQQNKIYTVQKCSFENI